MIEVRLPLPPSTNNLYINRGKKRIISPRYRAWREAAGWELVRQRPGKITGDYYLWFYSQRPDARRRDISNFVKAVEDLLVSHGVVKDDSDCAGMHLFWDADKGRECLVQNEEKRTLQQMFPQFAEPQEIPFS